MKQNVFIALIENLRRHNIKYALLRVDDIESLVENELDILVWPAHITEFRAIMHEMNFVCWKSRKFLKKEVYAQFDGNQLYLVDVHYALIQNGIQYMDMDGIFERLNLINDEFAVLSLEDQLLHYFYHNILGKHHVQSKHLDSINRLTKCNPNMDYLKNKIDDPIIYSMFDGFIKTPESFHRKNDEVLRTVVLIEKRLLARSYMNVIRVWYRKFILHKVDRRRGIHFALLGVDGAGKSSLIDALKQKLDQTKGIKFKIVYMGPWGHSRSQVHRWLKSKQITLPKEGSENSVSSEDGPLLNKLRPSSISKMIKRTIKAMVYYGSVYVELWYRYFAEIRPSLNEGHIILSDRYIYDLRYIYKKRIVKKHKLVRFLVCQLFPSPDKVIFLHNDPDIIFKRKPQLKKAEIELFQNLYKKALHKYEPMLLKTDRDPDTLTSEILKEIFSKLFKLHSN
jgi:thymidylate kinase